MPSRQKLKVPSPIQELSIGMSGQADTDNVNPVLVQDWNPMEASDHEEGENSTGTSRTEDKYIPSDGKETLQTLSRFVRYPANYLQMRRRDRGIPQMMSTNQESALPDTMVPTTQKKVTAWGDIIIQRFSDCVSLVYPDFCPAAELLLSKDILVTLLIYVL
jgi:hypothetical protein